MFIAAAIALDRVADEMGELDIGLRVIPAYRDRDDVINRRRLRMRDGQIDPHLAPTQPAPESIPKSYLSERVRLRDAGEFQRSTAPPLALLLGLVCRIPARITLVAGRLDLGSALATLRAHRSRPLVVVAITARLGTAPPVLQMAQTRRRLAVERLLFLDRRSRWRSSAHGGQTATGPKLLTGTPHPSQGRGGFGDDRKRQLSEHHTAPRFLPLTSVPHPSQARPLRFSPGYLNAQTRQDSEHHFRGLRPIDGGSGESQA